jgi:hypothetical protein
MIRVYNLQDSRIFDTGLDKVETCDATSSGKEIAVALLRLGNQEVVLCAHHFDKYHKQLIGGGWEVVIDTREGVIAGV